MVPQISHQVPTGSVGIVVHGGKPIARQLVGLLEHAEVLQPKNEPPWPGLPKRRFSCIHRCVRDLRREGEVGRGARALLQVTEPVTHITTNIFCGLTALPASPVAVTCALDACPQHVHLLP